MTTTLKVAKASGLGGSELSKFSDTPGDSSFEDLFPTLDKTFEDRAAEASTSASSSHVNASNGGKNELAAKLRATMFEKKTENEMGQNKGGDIIRLVMDVLRKDMIDIDGLVCLDISAWLSYPFTVYIYSIFVFFFFLNQVFDEKLPGENLFPLQVLPHFFLARLNLSS